MGLCLRRHPYGESSLVTHVLTRQHGRVSLLAKGAFRPRSGHAGLFDLFDTLELEWRPSRRSELSTFVGGRLLVRRRALTAGLDRYRVAVGMLELAELAALPGSPNPGLFDLLDGSLGVLAAGDVEPALARVAFDLRFLQNLGLTPSLLQCAACGGPAPASVTDSTARAPFSTSSGGRLCPNCAGAARAEGRKVGMLPEDLMRMADRLLHSPPELIPRFRLAPQQARRLSTLLDRLLEYHLETRPRSRRHASHTR